MIKSAPGAQTEAGFSLVEVVVVIGLISLALTSTYMIIENTQRAEGRLIERAALNSLMDNLATDLHSGTTYADQTNADFVAGRGRHTFTYDSGEQLGELQCSEESLGTAGTFMVLSCSTIEGIAVQRIVRVASDVPPPGSVVTAAPLSN